MNQKYYYTLSLVFFGLLFICPVFASAKIGVGMGAGEIRLTESTKPGQIYLLPVLRIFNTGDEVTTYDMHITYHQDHPELRPNRDWFSFNPEVFTIEPGKSQEVTVSLTIPLKTEPGEYFSFIESGPVAGVGPGTSVGVAVASKLFFTVVPANFLQAVGYRISSFFEIYSPWSWTILLLLVFIILFVVSTTVFRKFFSFNITMRKK